MENLNPEFSYITGVIIFGRLSPMGWSKDYEYALEMAKQHKQKIYKLIEVKDEI